MERNTKSNGDPIYMGWIWIIKDTGPIQKIHQLWDIVQAQSYRSKCLSNIII